MKKKKYAIAGTLTAAAVGGCFFGPTTVKGADSVSGTLNASGSIAVEQPQPTGTQVPAAQPTPSVTPAKAASKLVVYQNFTLLERYKSDSVDTGYSMPYHVGSRGVFSVFVKAVGGNVPIKLIRITQTGDAKDVLVNGLPAAFVTDVWQNFGGTLTILPGFVNGSAPFASGDKLWLAPEGKLVQINAGIGADVQTSALFKKNVGLSIKRASDIVTEDPNVLIEGTFPLDGPLFTFCCT